MLTKILKQDGLVQFRRSVTVLPSGQVVDHGYDVLVRVHEGPDLKAAVAAFERAVIALKIGQRDGAGPDIADAG